MNSCILMAEIIQDPQLRYTSDNQTPIAEMLVQFTGLREEDPPATLKVVGWGNLAQEIQEHYHEGDRIVIEGRLTMSTLDRPEGFKEKRAELTAQRIHRLGSDMITSTASTAENSAASTPENPSSKPRNQMPKSSSKPISNPGVAESTPAGSPTAYASASSESTDYDDIPF